MVDIFNYIWIFLIFLFLIPVIQQRLLNLRRIAVLKMIEARRRSRVITLIHRQERIAFLGIPFSRFIDIEDSKDILRAIRLTAPEKPIDLILHTPGGLVIASQQIARALAGHKGKVTVFVPHFAMSGGTLLALSGDEIAMDKNALLGPLDPQIENYPAVSIIKAVKDKPIARIEDKTLIYADVAKKALRQLDEFVAEILTENGQKEEKAKEIAKTLTEGKWTHDYPISFKEAFQMGLPVTTDVPKYIYSLMDLYDQPARSDRSVEYVRDDI
ncbi:MAG: hypothetical protein C4584_02670 [Armatimonadetes bacterium]|nr:MAG: hypothetical protein C4584_02670 [Armatimonadota bacterium]